MKKLKKLMFVPLVIGSVAASTACSIADVNLDEKNIKEIANSVNDYMNANNGYSVQYARDSLINLLNKGTFELKSKGYINYELTEKIKAYDDFGNAGYASEPYCDTDDYSDYTKCIQPYLSLKTYYDETSKTHKNYVYLSGYSTAISSPSSGQKYYAFIEYDGTTTDGDPYYNSKIYNVNSKTFETFGANVHRDIQEEYYWLSYSSKLLDYYSKIYERATSDEYTVTFNKVDETTVEYILNSSEGITTKCTFVNGMLEKYEQSDVNAFYGEPTNHAVAEVEIKYNTGDITVEDIGSYTEVTE